MYSALRCVALLLQLGLLDETVWSVAIRGRYGDGLSAR